MRPFIIAAAALACLTGPVAVHAQSIRLAPGQLPFEPAPVPDIDGGRIAPALRAGGALDAGPTNSTPFSGEASTVLEGTQSARALRLTRQNIDPSPTVGFTD